MSVLVEACVDSVPSALIAQQAGALRVELCDDLYDGGTTPSAGAIRLARERLSIGLHVIIRPRGGDFVYSELELEIVRHDLRLARDLGADGVVFGMLHPDGRIHRQQTAALVELAGDLSTTFHRAFDMCRDPHAALEELIELGVDRVLSSGQRPSALAGAGLLGELVERAGERIVVMPGVGIDPGNVAEVARRTRATELHVYTETRRPSAMGWRNPAVFMGTDPDLDEYEVRLTDGAALAAIVEAVR